MRGEGKRGAEWHAWNAAFSSPSAPGVRGQVREVKGLCAASAQGRQALFGGPNAKTPVWLREGWGRLRGRGQRGADPQWGCVRVDSGGEGRSREVEWNAAQLRSTLARPAHTTPPLPFLPCPVPPPPSTPRPIPSQPPPTYVPSSIAY